MADESKNIYANMLGAESLQAMTQVSIKKLGQYYKYFP